MKIPFFDLSRWSKTRRKQYLEATARVIDRGLFARGPEVIELEYQLSNYLSQDALAVNSGTSALVLALKSLGVQIGDEVIVPANGYIAAAHAVAEIGAKVVFADCNRATWQICVDSAKSLVSAKTKAIVGIHQFGQSFDLDAFRELCDLHGIALIEDAAQAFGGEYNGKPLGTIGDIGCFSFYPTKSLGALGEGGAITTHHDDVVGLLRSLRNFGEEQNLFTRSSLNYRMGEVDAALLQVNLTFFESRLARRIEIVDQIKEIVSHPDLAWQELVGKQTKSGAHLLVVRSETRDDLKRYLQDKGIHTQIHYPVPGHMQPTYASKALVSLPEAEQLSEQLLSLPLFPELSQEEVEYIADKLNQYN